MPNELINATSPYLLQHAHNPVAWREWNTDALATAKAQDKPILVSIGYSSCHWCHVMERECFEKEDIAKLMNDYFVCIKVDREERPDVDQIYMEAVQAMGGHGGWPLNVFLTPDQKPFYGGTYFPPAQWVHLLRQINATFVQKRSELEENADQLTRHISTSDLARFSGPAASGEFTKEMCEAMFRILNDRFDTTWGGIEKAPKFVMPSVWLFLLRYYAMSGNNDAIGMVSHTLIKMQQGGLYDQLGGGFARYSVDGRWFAPHFEKMLYDNAQLLTLYSEAYAATKNESFKKIVYETVDWLSREMRHRDGGFYSALDADSEGVEGKFYAWTWTELESVLGKDTSTVAEFFHCTKEGNWEHGMNILMDTSTVAVPENIRIAKEKMLQQRNTRVRPGLDDKILAGWNAMLITGLTDAYNVFSEPKFLALAVGGIEFIETKMTADKKISRSWKGKQSANEGFLEDYAFLIQAYISLYQATFNEQYLKQAETWLRYTLSDFADEGDGYFNFTGNQAESLIARKKEIFDNVIPGSNSVMARNLFHLGILLDNNEWKEKSISMISSLKEILQKEPGYLSNWGILLTEITQGMSEVVVSGPDVENLRRELATVALPFSLKLGSNSTSTLSLLQGRASKDGITRIFVCYNKTCRLPVTTTAEALQQLSEGNKV